MERKEKIGKFVSANLCYKMHDNPSQQTDLYETKQIYVLGK